MLNATLYQQFKMLDIRNTSDLMYLLQTWFNVNPWIDK